MATIQIPNLPSVTSLNGSELFELVQAGTSMRVTLAQIASVLPGLTVQEFMFLISQGLPGADPHSVGAWWNNGGVICISAG